jgi:spore coat polysaccharide biosynthesis protein SpsF (cytidylyltransferase family)
MTNINLNKKENIFTIITVRTSSKRLPKKCLKIINKKKVIEIIIKRAKKIGFPIILATTKDKADSILCNIAKKNKVFYFRGSKKNVLKRWNDCISNFNVSIAAIVDADDLLFDYMEYKKAINIITKKKYDYIRSNKNSITGLFTYVFRSEVLRKTYYKYKSKNIETPEPFLAKSFKFHSLKLKKDKKIRFTLDYLEDLVFFKKIFSKFPFTVKTTKVINHLKRFKNISKINYHRQNDYVNNQKKNYERL